MIVCFAPLQKGVKLLFRFLNYANLITLVVPNIIKSFNLKP
jgi:hypothetical protein